MEDIIFLFGICVVVVIDADGKLFGFIEEVQKITFWSLAQVNHKVISAEKHYLFLKNKIYSWSR